MDRAYITVIEWAKGTTRESAAAALAEAVGFDLYTARLNAAPPPPLVVACVDAAAAAGIVSKLRAGGATTYALTRSRLNSLPEPLMLKSLTPAMGAAEPLYMAQPWKGEPRGLHAADIFLIIRATLERTTTSISIEQGSNPAVATMGVAGIAAAGALNPATSVRSTTHDSIQLIDLFLHDGTHLRINARRFSFAALGEGTSFTTRENADNLALRLAKEAPEARLDMGFSQFRPPKGLVRDITTVTGNRTRHEQDEGAAFDFYAVWTYAIQRALAGKG